MTNHGLGIVGTGIIAATHAQAIQALPNARLIAVTDVQPDPLAAFAKQHDCAAEPDLAALLARDDVDVICVCVPSGLHADIGIQAAEAGKHLVIEKPIEVTLAAADRLIAAAAAANVKLTVISQHRFDPGLIELRRLLDDGALGDLVLGEARTKWYRTQAYYDTAAWRGTRALDGGALLNQGVHYVDLLRWCMGPVTEVTSVCATSTHDMEAEDTALVLLRFANGAVGTIIASTSVYPGFPQQLEITGSNGTVIIEDGAIAASRLLTDDGTTPDHRRASDASGGTADPALTGVASHAAQLADLLAAIDQDRDPLVTAASARDALEIVTAAYESARDRRPVTLR
jgi:predicted dehydrogenase